jgi:lysine-N-methylase
MKNKRRSLVPQYMNQFSCIGSSCEDSCCVGWRVAIDEATYKKYNRVHDLELTPLFAKKVTRNRSNPSAENYARIKMNSDNTCVFLTEDRWCKIQQKLGEDYLSKTCAAYPRISNEVNGVLERSATVSCPEVARLALLNPDGIEFDEIESEELRKTINKRLDTQDKKLLNNLQKYFWELRIFTIQVLQNRSYSLSERLIILGMFYQKLEEYMSNDSMDSIPQLIASYTAIIKEGSLKESLDQIPQQATVQMELVKEMTDHRFMQGVNNQRYKDCYTEMLKGLNYITGTPFTEVAKAFPEVYESCYKPFMDEHEYILENYLVNYVYKNLFPFSGFPTLFDNYVMLVVHYSMIKLHLIGMAGHHKGLNTDLVIKLIQSFSKTVEHNQLFLKGLFDLLKKKGFTTMAYMAILIKN